MISINFTLFVQIAHFLILVWIMNKLLIKPIMKHIQEKEAEIAARKSTVDGLVSEAEDRQVTYKEQLKTAHQKAAEERDKLLSEAKAEAADLREKSVDEGRKLLEKVRTEIQDSLSEVKAKLTSGEDDLAEALAQSYLGRKS